jgi:RNA polymerase sigma factor (sigma-70 family)
MTRTPLTPEIERLVAAAAASIDDAELLRRYRANADADAFAAIVRRHGRTVLGVCSRVLRDPQAAEDAFQATFLQLVRTARSLHSPAALAAWLCTTARRTALRGRRLAATPPLTVPQTSSQSPLDGLTARELLAAIDEEIARLPEPYRLPLVLCYLDGLSKHEAADRLGVSVGVFRGRLDRGRDKLRAALVRRGFAPAALLGLLVPGAGTLSAELIRRTAAVCLRREAASGAVATLAAGPPSAKTMVALAVGVLLLGGLGLIAATSRGEPPQVQAKAEATQPAEASPRRDVFGDELPPDAIARLGTIRWRHAEDRCRNFRLIPSPTGAMAATVGWGEAGQKTVRVWNLPDGKPLCEFPSEDDLSGFGVQFTQDGARLMLLGPRGVVKFRDPRTGKVLAESRPVIAKDDIRDGAPASGSYSVTPHQLTEDGCWVATWVQDQLMLTEIVTDAAAAPRKVKLEQPTGEFHSSHFRFFAVNGDEIVGCYNYSEILRWNLATGRLGKRIPISSSNMVIANTGDGQRIATWRYDVPPKDPLRVWDAKTGTEVVELEGSKRKGYGDIRFSQDGKRLVAEAERTKKTTTAIVWELESGKVVGRVKLPAWCYHFHILPDGKTILAASFQGIMFGAWDIASGARLSPVTGHEFAVDRIVFTPDGKTVLTASTEPGEPVTTWDAATGKRLRELTVRPGRSTGMIKADQPFVLTPGGGVVTTGEGILTWTDLKTGRELRKVMPPPIATTYEAGYDQFSEEKLSLALDPRTGKPAVLGTHSFGPTPFLSDPKHGSSTVITLWDAESGELLAHRAFALNSWKWGRSLIEVSPDGAWLARESYDSTTRMPLVLLESVLTGRAAIALPHKDELDPEVLFTPDGQSLVTIAMTNPKSSAANTSTIQVRELRSGKVRVEFVVPFACTVLAVSPDGRFLAGANNAAKTIIVWDLATGAEVAKRGGFGTAVETLTFRPDGRALASGHADGTALIWDLSGLPAVTPAATDRDAAWKALAAADAKAAYRAIVALAADPDGAAFVRERVKPATAMPVKDLQKLVKDLGDEDFQVREAATAALTKQRDLAEPELRAALRQDATPEQQRRIREVLDRQNLTESDPDRLRLLRSVEVLERAGTGTARAHLQALAKGAASARLTREAAAAVRRLEQQARTRE